MSILNQRKSPLSRQLAAYEESWKLDYLAAQDCYDWEELIAVGTTVGEALERANREWRKSVFRGVREFDGQTEGLFRDALRLWLAVTDAVLNRAAALEKTFGVVAGLTEVRAVKSRIEQALAGWNRPTIASAVGWRDQQLTPEDAQSLDALISRPAPPLPARRFDGQDSSFLQ